MKRRPDTADKILRIAEELRALNAGTRDADGGQMRRKAPEAGRGMNRKNMVRKLTGARKVTQKARPSENRSAHGVGSMILRAVRSGKGGRLPPGPIVDKLNESMRRKPANETERAIVKAAKARVRARLGKRAHKAARAKGTTTRRSNQRAQRVRELRASGGTQEDVARQLGITVRTVRRLEKK